MVEGEKERPPGQDPALNGGTAAEIERLGDELAGARDQLAATSEVLAVIGRSASDLKRVLEAVESARKLRGAETSVRTTTCATSGALASICSSC